MMIMMMMMTHPFSEKTILSFRRNCPNGKDLSQLGGGGLQSFHPAASYAYDDNDSDISRSLVLLYSWFIEAIYVVRNVYRILLIIDLSDFLDSERRLEDYEKPMHFIKNKKPQLFLRHNVSHYFWFHHTIFPSIYTF